MGDIEDFQKVILPPDILKTAKDLAILMSEHIAKNEGTNPKDEYQKSCEAIYSVLEGTEIDLNKNNQLKHD